MHERGVTASVVGRRPQINTRHHIVVAMPKNETKKSKTISSEATNIVDDDEEMKADEGPLVLLPRGAPAGVCDDINDATAALFAPLEERGQSSSAAVAPRTQYRKIAVPQNRLTPLKTNWLARAFFSFTFHNVHWYVF